VRLSIPGALSRTRVLRHSSPTPGISSADTVCSLKLKWWVHPEGASLCFSHLIVALRWSESRVADFEAGRVAPTLTTLAALCLALTDLKCPDATLPDLITNPRPVEINESLALMSQDLRNVLAGKPVRKPVTLDPREGGADSSFSLITDSSVLHGSRVREEHIRYRYGGDIPRSTYWAVRRASGATEERMRKRLGISSLAFHTTSAALWKRSFSEERDRRAGPGANAQKRGQVSRQLMAELQKAINDGDS
jgi:hypothetical protein